MRLLLITNVYPNPWQRTRGIFNLQMARALARNHELRVITPISWVDELRGRKNGSEMSKGDREEVIDGIPVYYPRFYYPPKIWRRQYGPFLWHSVRGTVRRVLKSFTPEAVLGYWEHPDGEVAVRIARLVGAPAVVISGGSGVLVLAKDSGRRRCIAKVLESADAVVAVSQDLQSKIIDLGIPAEKVHVVSRGVDRSLFSPASRIEARRRLQISEDVPMLLWVGRMVTVKGLDLLMEACSDLKRRGVNFRMYLVGDGPLRRELEADCRARGLTESVIFVGLVQHNQLPDWFRSADLTVLPSRSEGIPNVLRESLACGTPFVASQVGGIAEIAAASPQNKLIPVGDFHALGESIRSGLAKRVPIALQVNASPSWYDSAEALIGVIRPLVVAAKKTTNGEIRKTQGAMYGNPGSGSKSRLRQLVRWGLATTLPRHLFLASGSPQSHSVCLTFDDGPHPDHTPRLLDVLKEHQVRATFFVVGREAARFPEIVRRIRAEGHIVGNHSYTHSPVRKISSRQMLREVRQTGRLLTEILDDSPRWFRPPHGKLTGSLLLGLWALRKTVVLWNVDPKDYNSQSSEEICSWFQRNPLRAGDVVLFHDKWPFIIDALPPLIAAARREGVDFSTIAEWSQ